MASVSSSSPSISFEQNLEILLKMGIEESKKENLNKSYFDYDFDPEIANQIDTCYNQATDDNKKIALKDTLEKIETVFFLAQSQNAVVQQQAEQNGGAAQQQAEPRNYNTLLSLLLEKNDDTAATAARILPLKLSTTNTPNVKGKTPLHLACAKAHKTAALTLLSLGADPSAIYEGVNRNRPWTPLSEIIGAYCEYHYNIPEEDANAIFDALLQAKSDPKKGYVHGLPLFNKCMRNNRRDWAAKIINLIDVNQGDCFNRRPLHWAAGLGVTKFVTTLLERGANPNSSSSHGYTSVMEAVENKKGEALRVLIKHGGDPHLRTVIMNSQYQKETVSPFSQAVDDGWEEGIQIICELAPPTPEQMQGFSRHFLNKPIGKKADLGTIMAAAAAKKFSFKAPGGIPFYSPEEDYLTPLKQLTDTHFSKSPSKESFKPAFLFWNLLVEMAKKNPKFAFYFLQPDAGNMCGAYNAETRSEIMFHHDPKEKKMMEILVHEMTHAVSHIIYPGSSIQVGPPTNSTYHQNVKKDIADLFIKSLDHKFSDHAPYIHSLFANTQGYPESQHTSEYLARTSQLLVYLSLEKGLSDQEVMDTMQLCLPETFAFFQNDFIPACERALKTLTLPAEEAEKKGD